MTSEVNHLLRWSIDVQRNWDPHYYFNGERVAEAFPPFTVNVFAEFDHQDSALRFQQKVMAWLEDEEGRGAGDVVV